uniref:Uncharacterized protein n=1 Tax=Leersia perrieri TaxID=77586 RepID=A0A0D9XQ62_9ORYZ
MVCKAPTILGLPEEKLRSKIDLLSSTIGCSIDSIGDMLCKIPKILGLSEKNLHRKMEFFVTKVGLEPTYILGNPMLLTFSLEKRVVPRHYVLQVLVAKGLIKDVVICTLVPMVEKNFVARYIDQYSNTVPGLADAYAAVCAGRVPPDIRFRILLSTAANATATTPFSVEEYLVATCGLTGAQALKSSARISHLKSASNPDAVLGLLSGVGLSPADIAAVVASDPLLLRASADMVGSRISSLRRRVGLTDPQIGSILLAGGAIGLRSGDIASRLEFWIPFYGSFESFLKILKVNRCILTTDMEKVVKPNVALLHQCGISVCDIAKMSQISAWLLTLNPKQVEAFVQCADELGVPCNCSSFKYMVAVTSRNSKGRVAAKMEFLSTTLGCSADEVRSAICKLPQILGLSEINLRSKIEFLVSEVRLEPDDILKRPQLLAYSLDKRLAPRHYIVQVLVAKGLMKDVPFRTYVDLPENDFLQNFIDRHKNVIPGLSEAYAAVRAGEDYLVATCGLTASQAVKASRKVSQLKSASNPDAVLAHLSAVGLSRADLAAVVAAEPRVLLSRADSVARRFASLRGRAGLSDPQIASVLLAGGALRVCSADVSAKLAFLIPFMGSFEMLLKMLRRNNAILCSSLENVIKPNIELLHECGLSVCDIVTMAQSAAWVFTFKPERLKVVVKRAEELGVPANSWAFKYIVSAVARTSEGSVAARMEFLSTTLGCSVDELRSAVGKCPQILGLTESKVRSKIEFLVNKVGLDPHYILQRLVLLTLSLEKRLVPRHYVLQTLLVKGLIKKDLDFFHFVCIANGDFMAKYIDRHEGAIPGLADAYTAVCSGKLPAKV